MYRQDLPKKDNVRILKLFLVDLLIKHTKKEKIFFKIHNFINETKMNENKFKMFAIIAYIYIYKQKEDEK